MSTTVVTLPGVKRSAKMPSVRLPYVKRYTVKGKVYCYFRRKGYAIELLPGAPRSREFMAAYCAAMAQVPVVTVGLPKAPKESRIASGTVRAAIDAYLRSSGFAKFAKPTRGAIARTLFLFGKGAGDLSLAKVTTDAIREVVEAKPAGSGKKWLNAIRNLFDYAIETKAFPGPNPCVGLSVKREKSDGHHTWSEDEIARYEARHQVGPGWEGMARKLFTTALFTGQRLSDLIAMGPHNMKDGKLVVKQSKTKATVQIPVHPELARVLAAGPDIAPTFVYGARGHKLSTGRVDEMFRVWCREAGLPDHCVLHGLRKAICRRLVAMGMSPHQIMAITGHKTLAEVQRYCDEFSREVAGEQAMAALSAYGR